MNLVRLMDVSLKYKKLIIFLCLFKILENKLIILFIIIWIFKILDLNIINYV